MMRYLIISAVLLCTAQPAEAAGRCSKPYAPVITASAGATKAELARLRADVQDFLAASDAYQLCLIRSGRNTDSLLASNQAEKERVGRAFNTLVRASQG
jgi:hypothetical protein